MPATTAIGVASSWNSARQHAELLERAEDDPGVAEDDLPADRAQQEAGEERRDDEEQQQVLEPAAAERDRVGQRVRDQEREHGRRRAVQDRARELRPEAGQRLGVVRDVRQGELVAGLQRPRPERGQEHLERRARRRTGPARGGRAPAAGTGRPACAAAENRPRVPLSAVRRDDRAQPRPVTVANCSLKYFSVASSRPLKMCSLARIVRRREDQRVVGRCPGRRPAAPRPPP